MKNERYRYIGSSYVDISLLENQIRVRTKQPEGSHCKTSMNSLVINYDSENPLDPFSTSIKLFRATDGSFSMVKPVDVGAMNWPYSVESYTISPDGLAHIHEILVDPQDGVLFHNGRNGTSGEELPPLSPAPGTKYYSSEALQAMTGDNFNKYYPPIDLGLTIQYYQSMTGAPPDTLLADPVFRAVPVSQ